MDQVLIVHQRNPFAILAEDGLPSVVDTFTVVLGQFAVAWR